jgi:hypothetical protein
MPVPSSAAESQTELQIGLLTPLALTSFVGPFGGVEGWTVHHLPQHEAEQSGKIGQLLDALGTSGRA